MNERDIKDFIIELQQIGLSENSRKSYQLDLIQYMQFLKENYHNLGWEMITQDHVRHYLAMLHDAGSRATTVSRKISALRKFHKYLKVNRITADDPMLKIELPKKRRDLPDFLTENEIERLLSVPDVTTLQGIRDKAILEVMYATGLRVSELCQLTRSQVHLDTHMIHIIGKGNKERIVILGEEAIESLEMYYNFVRPKYENDHSGNIVFLNRRGKAFTRQGIWKLLKQWIIQAGITKNVTPHTIRHSVATHLLSRGMDLRMIQELLGHDHLVTTQIYTHLETTKMISEYTMAHPHAKKRGINYEL